MKIPLFTSLVRRHRRDRMRRIMRGYRFLRNSKSLNRIGDINRALTKLPLNIKERRFSRHIFGEGLRQAELVCRQYLLTRVAGLNLNRALLHALGKPGSPVVYSLPPEWRTVIRNRGFRIASFRTAWMWQAFVGIMLARGVLTMAKIVLNGMRAPWRRSTPPLGRYAYFSALSSGNLPQPGRDGRSHDIITWYMQWPGRDAGIDTLCHGAIGVKPGAVNGIPVVAIPALLPPLPRLSSLPRFLAWGLVAGFIAAWDLLRGRWWHALLLNQAALAAQARMQSPGRLARDYLFHNSGWIYRPLWTYEAEKRGSRIIFYFYSTNCESFKQPEGDSPIPFGWEAMNWPYYLVWDEYQADFVRRAVGPAANIYIVGHIWFSAGAEEVPLFSGQSVAVFDVTPHCSPRYQTYGIDFEYYVPDTCIPFLRDIQRVTEEAGYVMLWKRKRKIGNVAHPRYRFYAERLAETQNVIIVDPDVSANRVIEASAFVVSMPFTSTALIGRELGKPSCYYDPTGRVQKDDRAAHGIEVIRGREELSRWLHDVRQLTI